MARYFLHLHDDHQQLLDPEGVEHVSLHELRSAVLAAARSLISADANDGVINLKCRIDAEDEDGEVVHTLPFDQAVSIIPARI